MRSTVPAKGPSPAHAAAEREAVAASRPIAKPKPRRRTRSPTTPSRRKSERSRLTSVRRQVPSNRPSTSSRGSARSNRQALPTGHRSASQNERTRATMTRPRFRQRVPASRVPTTTAIEVFPPPRPAGRWPLRRRPRPRTHEGSSRPNRTRPRRLASKPTSDTSLAATPSVAVRREHLRPTGCPRSPDPERRRMKSVCRHRPARPRPAAQRSVPGNHLLHRSDPHPDRRRLPKRSPAPSACTKTCW